MKTKIIAAVCAVLICISSAVPVLSADTVSFSSRACDYAQILDRESLDILSYTLDEISERQKTDIVIISVTSLHGKDVVSFADDYYDYGGYADDGILLLVAVEEREWAISTKGYGTYALTDTGNEYISDIIVPYLTDEDYYTAFTEFASLCDLFISQAKTDSPYDSGNLPKGDFDFGGAVLVSVIIGFIISIIAVLIMKGQLKSVRYRSAANDYLVDGSLNVSVSRDFFLYHTVSRRVRPKQSSGSSTHTSSSGSSHGGSHGSF